MKSVLLFLALWSGSMPVQAQTPDLDYFLDQARRNSPLLRQNANERELISLDMQQVESLISRPEIYLEGNIVFAPIVSHDGGSPRFEWASEGATDYTGYDLAITDGGQYQAGLAIRKLLLTGSVLQSYAERADVSREMNKNNRALTVHELEQLVGYQYILCLKAKAQSAYSRMVLDRLNDQLAIMEKLVARAVYKQTDRMLMQIERTHFEEAYQTSRAEYRSSVYDLNLICGIKDTTFTDIVETVFQLHAAPVAASKFENSFRLDSLNLVAEQSVFEQKYKPRLYWFASAGLNASYLPTPNRLGFSTGLSFNWTIFDGHQRRIRQEMTNLNLNTIEFNRMDFIRKSGIRQNKIIREIQSIGERETLAREQLSQYDWLIDAYLSELPLGGTSIMNLKNLIRERAMKQQQLVELKMERYLLINSYNYWNY